MSRAMSIGPRHIFSLFEIIEILGRKLGLVDLKEFDQNFIRSRNHNILPETQIAIPFLSTMPPDLSLLTTSSMLSVWIPKW